nr:type VII secretion integral membrane protein EccD [Mycolicibacterium komanii]CRL74554.1 transmembrane protein [Mycolicibacterium komanii]
MTGIEELRTVEVVPAAPETIRVAVLGGRTQLDVALPAEVPVAAFLPELARLITSRDEPRDSELADRDARRTYWALSRADGGGPLAPDETLRGAGVANGELLRLSQKRALSPPTLYDDVVDAAARLNRAAYAAWDAAAARVMAVAGLWTCSAVWLFLLMAEQLSAHRGGVAAGAGLVLAAMVGGATLANRGLARADIAASASVPVVLLVGALTWTAARHSGPFVLAAACAAAALAMWLCLRLIGAGQGIYVAAAVFYATVTGAGLAVAVGAGPDVVAVVVATSATLLCLAVPRLTAKWNRVPVDTNSAEDRTYEFGTDAGDRVDPGTAMPSAEQVWTLVRSATMNRAGLLTGLGVVVAVSGATLMQIRTAWPTAGFAVVCAAVLALLSRRRRHALERFALAVPAVALVLFVCVRAQTGDLRLALVGLVVLALTGLGAVVAGLTLTGRRRFVWIGAAAAYAEYVAICALLPMALWPLGVYERLVP